MKTWKKFLLAFLALIIIAGIVCATMFTSNEKKVKEYSGYCMDEIRAQLWEYVWNISNMWEGKNDEWYYLYNWNVSYEWVNYTYFCKVLGKGKVDLELNKVNEEVCEWESCDVSEEPEEFISYYDNWSIRETWTYVNGMKEGIWTTYDEEWNIINTEEYKDWKLVNWTEEDAKALIIVFSPTGNTKRIATFISEINGSELTELIPVQEYTDEDRNWRNEESRTFKEFKDPSIRPEIENEISLAGYDIIYLWFPIWFGITPNIILTLLENYDFTGKNIVLFCTSEHVGIEKAVEYLEPYNLNVIGSKRFEQGATKEEVQEWLENLSL